MKRIIAVAALGLAALMPCTSWAQSTAPSTVLSQVSAQSCAVTGCINAKLSDGELFTFSDMLRYYGSYPINGRLAFRGLNYDMTGQSSGYQVIDLSGNGGQFAVHEEFAVRCYRGCTQTWLRGSLTVANEYIGTQPTNYGSSGYPAYTNISTGTGQVGLVSASQSDTLITLTSSDVTLIQVPSEVTILAGALDANFTITATAPTQPNSPPDFSPSTVVVTATFPDGQTASVSLLVTPLPPPPPIDQ